MAPARGANSGRAGSGAAPDRRHTAHPAYPHITRVETTGDRATVYVNIEYRTLVGADRYCLGAFPQAFPLLREGVEWRIADDLYVEAIARPQLREEAEADAKAGVRTPSTHLGRDAGHRDPTTISRPSSSPTTGDGN